MIKRKSKNNKHTTEEKKVVQPDTEKVNKISERSGPFDDVQLEDSLLRHIIFDEGDDFDQVSKNLNIMVGFDIPKEIFNDIYKQKLYEQLYNNAISHSETLSKKTLLRRLEKKGDAKEINAYRAIIDNVFKKDYTPVDFKSMLDDIIDNWRSRSLILALQEGSDYLKDNLLKRSQSALQITQNVVNSCSKILQTASRFEVIECDVYERLDEYFDKKDKLRKDGALQLGITTGFAPIDEAIGGWYPGTLTILCGRPGQGKSALLMNFAHYAHADKRNVLYFNLELTYHQFLDRFVSFSTKTCFDKVRLPFKATEEDYSHMKEKMQRDKNSHYNNVKPNFLQLINKSNCNVPYIESKILEFENKTNKKIELVIVDPLYFLKPISNPQNEIPAGIVSMELKNLALKFNVPVITASQLNRESHKRHKKGQGADVMDAAFSDKLGQNSDNMIFIVGDDRFGKLAFPKTRDGSIKELRIVKDLGYMQFKIYDGDEDLEEVNDE